MPLHPDPHQGNYLHLEISKEPEWNPERRRRQGFSSEIPRPKSHQEHAQKIGQSLVSSIKQAEELSKKTGVDPSHLLVLKFDSINNDLTNTIEKRFDARIVEERKEKIEKQDQYHMLVHFRDKQALEKFQEEAKLYEGKLQPKILPTREREDFFDSLQTVRLLSPEDRKGIRLKKENFPTGDSYYDLDIWHPGDEEGARQILQEIRLLCSKHSGHLRESIKTESLLLAKVWGSRSLIEILLEMPNISRIDLPPQLQTAYSKMFDPLELPDLDILTPESNEPMVCVIDSGVISGHPLLRNWIVDERDFDSGENTYTDLNGHGTAVAGLVIYGDIARCIETGEWKPRVKICSAKVLCNSSDNDYESVAVFPDKERVEEVTERAIRHFFEEHGCRIFNLSLGDTNQVYDGSRQFPWAEKLDQLARELDIVIVISAGNKTDPDIPNVQNRDEFHSNIRSQLLGKEYRVCNPATSALAITVGSIARSSALGSRSDKDSLRVKDAIIGAPENSPSPFTRTGFGYEVDKNNSVIKPDLVHYGGNYALRKVGSSPSHWLKKHPFLGEITAIKEISGRFIGSQIGTSFSCPKVAHGAALALHSLNLVLGEPPSANLIRALLASATVKPSVDKSWPKSKKDILRLIGYGMCDIDDLIWSKSNRVRLVTEDEIKEDTLHIYEVPLPNEFFETQGRKGVTISLAFDPQVRASRKEYLSRTMEFELFQALTTEDIKNYRARVDESLITNHSKNIIELEPPKSMTKWSTLQVRRVEWKKHPKFARNGSDSKVHILVKCRKRFPTDQDVVQKYALVALFWHELEEVKLYQTLKNRVRTKVRIRQRV